MSTEHTDEPPKAPADIKMPVDAPKPQGRLATIAIAMTLAGAAIGVAGWYRHANQIDALQTEIDRLRVEIGSLRRPAGATPEIDLTNVPYLGSKDALVTLVEFSDYECPFCIRHFQATWPLIQQNYIQTGKIRYVFRDFPIDQNHPAAIKAHEAAHCAIEQNKFWEMHNRLFTPPGSHTPDQLDQRAVEAGLNISTFRDCVKSGRTTENVREISQIAQGFGADGTPAFFVGVRDPATEKVRISRGIKGAVPYEQFAQTLDAVLGRK